MSEVVVVGAGPAGATLSYLLARSGVRVTLFERQEVLDREFRGPAYQPAVVRLWDEMGVLDRILELDVHKFEAFSFFEGKARTGGIELSTLPLPYNYVLVMEQASLLKRMIALCGQYPNFTYLGGHSYTGEEEGARLVVGCDGRFSSVRKAAGIEIEEAKQSFDVIWFEIPMFPSAQPEVGLHATSDGILIYLPKEGGLMQVGWIVGKGEYQRLKAKGIDYFKGLLAAIEPQIAEPLTSWEQCHLLDVKMGVAKEWVRDGLLLLGDAAHIASPMGALGNKLAIEDAVLAYPYIIKALKTDNHVVPKEALLPFVGERRPVVEKILRLQRVMGKVMLELPFIRRHVVPLLTKTPAWKKIRDTVALSSAKVETRFFRDAVRRYHLLRVKEIRVETAEAKTFVFETPADFSPQPGQFITLRLLKRGRLYKRCYSLSSIPGEDLAITVKRVEGGIVSSALHDEVAVGDRLLVLPPAGDFVACDAPAYTFVAGGSGITPVYSLIRSLLPKAKVTLFYVNHSPEATIFRRELEALEGLSLHHHWTAEMGRPTSEALEPFLTGELYLCGPPGLMELVGDRPARQETYASVTGLQEERHQGVPPVEVGSGGEGEPKRLSVTLNGETREVRCRKGETLLDAALAAGLPAPFSCQEGICSTCKAHLLSGKVRMDRHDSLTEEDLKGEMILTCRAKPLTESCSVRYQRGATS